MHVTKIAILTVIVLLCAASFMVPIKADSNNEGSLNSGYAVTSNYHGKDVPIGADVTVTAKTTDSKTDFVLFIWKDPAGHIIWQEETKVTWDGTYFGGKKVYSAQSVHKPETIGDWGVQAKFYDETRNKRGDIVDTRLATRATSFNVIPELPLIGTAGASAAMIFGLALFKIKRKPS
jgi:hypothetical protein